jgi:hypothetical protein
MSTENSQPNEQESTVYWRPDEQITVTGTELAALLHLVDLQTVAINQVPLNTLMELFSTANAAKTDIMQRLSNEGKLSNAPLEYTPSTPTEEPSNVIQFETEQEEVIIPEGQVTLEDLKNITDIEEVSDEIL